ncbi:hypothetical protein DAPPUDRAFT_23736, partial [Daphnia pulex]
LALVLFSFCLATVLGNALVIAAVTRERYLHTVTNYFIMSLAVADCLVGSIVMPFSAAVEMQSDRPWLFGRDLCDVWHSFDVLVSTASILNLCVISVDRYWAITDPFTYPSRMTPKRAACFIALVWVCSILVSFPTIAWWKAVAANNNSELMASSSTSGTNQRKHPVPEQCIYTDDIGYLVFSSTISFYGPLSVMVFTYYRIYRAAVAQSRSLRLGTKRVVTSTGGIVKGTERGLESELVETVEPLMLRIHRGGRAASEIRRCAAAEKSAPKTVLSVTSSAVVASDNESGRYFPIAKLNLIRKLSKIAKERKAAKTLGIVMGVFVVCWSPFFVTTLLSAFCQSCIHDPELVGTIVNWLGWINSAMNPVIYACWSRDFRRAFTRILCGWSPQQV